MKVSLTSTRYFIGHSSMEVQLFLHNIQLIRPAKTQNEIVKKKTSCAWLYLM